MNSMLVVARKEFRDDFRNRWTIAVAILFALLALGIAYFGGAAAGKVGFTSFAATLASLTTLAAFIIPLIGLLIAYHTIVGERDSGTLLLILSYPLSRTELVAGKFAGHCAALAAAALAGFGLTVAVIQLMQPQTRTLDAWLQIGNFVASASMLGAAERGGDRERRCLCRVRHVYRGVARPARRGVCRGAHVAAEVRLDA